MRRLEFVLAQLAIAGLVVTGIVAVFTDDNPVFLTTLGFLVAIATLGVATGIRTQRRERR
jgi:hypothetical protein